jgi:hypothetical protein
MATTITWTIDWMSASTQTINGFTEVVLSSGWRCTGTDTATPPNASTIYGTCSFPEPTTSGSFTPYAQLTQSQVVGWCWENGVDQSATEAAINANIALLENPPVTQPPLPWLPQPTTATA